MGPGEQTFCPKGQHQDEGIDTRFFTSIYIEGDQIWRFCFERGWLENDSGGWQIRDRMEQAATAI